MTSNAVYDFTGRTAVVTGGSIGIGLGVALRLAASGARVGILDPAPLPDDLPEGIRSRLLHVACDVTDERSVSDAIAAVGAEAPVDLLVNNAGASVHAAPETYRLADWEHVLRVNLTGTFLLCREVVARRGAGPISIVNLSSIAASSSLGRGIFAYGAAKAGIEELTRDLAVEWAGEGIRVNAVAPCQVETPGYARVEHKVSTGAEDIRARALSGIPMRRFATVDEVAAAVVFLLSDEAAMITGSTIAVDGGNLALNAGGSVRASHAPA